MKLTRLKLLLFFLLFGALITGISIGLQFFFLKNEIQKEFLIDSETIITAKSRELTSIKEYTANTVLSLSYSHFLADYLRQPSEEAKKHLQKSFFEIMAILPDIMQLRYLDNAGNEIVKLNRDEPYGMIEEFSGDDLENKKDRYYFTEIERLPPGDVYLSELDLNVEHGEIEIPLKPTLRAGTRVLDGNTPQGMIVINFFMSPYITSLKNIELVSLYLADSEGYFLAHPDDGKSWSRFFDRNSTVGTEFRVECGKGILEEASCRFHDIYSVTIDPLTSEKPLKLIAKMNRFVLDLEEQELRKNILIQSFVIIFFALVLSGIFGRYISRVNERLLLHSELLDTAGDGIIVHNLQGHLIYVNETACRERGYTKDEMLQLSVSQLDAPEYRAMMPENIRELKHHGHVQFRIEHLRKDGSRLPLGVRAKLFDLNGEPTVMSITRDITARLEIEKRLYESEERYRRLVETAVSGIFQTTVHGEILFANPAMKRILGYNTEDSLEHVNIVGFYKKAEKRRELLHLLREKQMVENYEFEIINKRGEERNILLNVSLEDKMITGMFVDITEIKKAQEQIRALSQIVTQIDDSVALTDINGIIQYINDAFTRHTGYSREEIIGKTPRVLKSGQHPKDFFALLWETILAGDSFRATFINKKKGDGIFYEEKTISPLKNEKGEITGFVSTAKDITERVEMEKALKNAAQTDHLTGLYNRLKFEKSLTRALEMHRRYGHRFSLILFDVDHFKAVNDTYGHDVGDDVLRQLSALLNERMRQTDIVARWGGEEFIVLLPEADIGAAGKIAEELRSEVERHLFEAVEHVTVSLGITEASQDDTEADIIKRADEALYNAKAAGRNRVVEA